MKNLKQIDIDIANQQPNSFNDLPTTAHLADAVD
jgi:hypothetical protein